jgi:hypothetical protein
MVAELVFHLLLVSKEAAEYFKRGFLALHQVLDSASADTRVLNPNPVLAGNVLHKCIVAFFASSTHVNLPCNHSIRVFIVVTSIDALQLAWVFDCKLDLVFVIAQINRRKHYFQHFFVPPSSYFRKKVSLVLNSPGLVNTRKFLVRLKQILKEFLVTSPCGSY